MTEAKQADPLSGKPAAGVQDEDSTPPAADPALVEDAGAQGAVEDASSGGSVEELRLMLEDARAKADGHWDQLLRLKAEMENLRKRNERDVEAARKYALDTFVAELLPVRDSLELGIQAATGENADLDKVREGSELTLKLLGDVMGKFGVEQIDPEGQPFNPDLHQAMSAQPRDDVPPNMVIAVMQKGYALNGRLVRPALVFVSQAAD